MKKFLTFLSVAMFLALSAPSVSAQSTQPSCMIRESMIENVNDRSGGQPFVLGIASNGWIVEAVITPDGRWTMIATDINGISCFLGAGSKWTYPVPLGFETNY